jgi:hypothetical protein
VEHRGHLNAVTKRNPFPVRTDFGFKEYSKKKKKTQWSESASELYRPSDRCLSAKLVPTFADRGCHVVSVECNKG